MAHWTWTGSAAFCIVLAATAATVGACRTAARADIGDEGPSAHANAARESAPQDQPEMAWWRKSMETRDARLGWWREARFGMFIHWGVYSHLAGVWEGVPVTGYAEHIQRKNKIPMVVYREKAAGQFNPTGFDADTWVRAAKDAGMGYLIITAKHHDGFAMYDSQVSDYNVVKATPWKHDPMRDLKEACRRQGVRFGFYYSHAFDWGEADGPGNDWDYKNPGGDLLLHGGRDWWVATPSLLPRIRRYVDGKAIPQIQELIRKYDPDILWFDTPHKLPAEDNLRILRAVREAKPDIVVNGRAVQVVPGGPEARFGDYASTADKPAEMPPHDGDWEAIPTTNESYGYHRMDLSHKPPQHFVQLLAKAAARGGNLLLNIGPMGDGRFDPKDAEILAGIGSWMKTNAESIKGTQRTPLPVQSWGHSTLHGNRLYLHVFDWPADGRLYVAGLKTDVTKATLLGRPTADVGIARVNPLDVVLQVPAEAPDPWDSVIAIDAASEIVADPAIFVPASGASLHVFDGRLSLSGIHYMDGKRDRDAVMEWNEVGAGVEWRVRALASSKLRVAVTYSSLDANDGGTFEIVAGNGAVLTASVKPTSSSQPFATVDLGLVTLPVGETTIAIRAKTITGAELMRLRRIELRPAS
jgi:alpha-L-fucosidase